MWLLTAGLSRWFGPRPQGRHAGAGGVLPCRHALPFAERQWAQSSPPFLFRRTPSWRRYLLDLIPSWPPQSTLKRISFFLSSWLQDTELAQVPNAEAQLTAAVEKVSRELQMLRGLQPAAMR